MPHRVVEHSDPRAFHDAVIDRLMQSEVKCCIQIGLIRRMASEGYSPISVDELDRPLLWMIEDGARIELVAIQTRKNTMVVTRAPQATAPARFIGLSAPRGIRPVNGAGFASRVAFAR
jgi:hypothetical protein